MATLRPPAAPLVTVDPYFSIWSLNNNLHEGVTRHWTKRHHGMCGIAVIDGVAWRFMGGLDIRDDIAAVPCPSMDQTGVTVEPLSTVYTFEAGGISLLVDFTTPLLLDDLDILSRPASYVTFAVRSIDATDHKVQIYYDITAELCVHNPQQEVVWASEDLTDGSIALKIGTKKQAVLERKGDDVRIDWGYAYLVVPRSVPAKTTIRSVMHRQIFVETGTFIEAHDMLMPRAAEDDMPALAALLDLGTIGSEERSCFIVLAYDDILSVEYFHAKLPAYWKRKGMAAEQMLTSAISQYSSIMSRCAVVNEQVRLDAIRSGGEKYADILSLAYRQAIAAHKLVEDEDGQLLFFSKENFSNGCMATVDVSYPSIPIFLLYNPELVKGMMRPIFRYANSREWPYPFAPHDVGRFPIANGQAYGLNIERQMPVEECGNMLIMAAAVCMVEGKANFAKEHWELLTLWVDYLKKNGLDPGYQLCTDDFGGHLPHNANLSIKAIIGIGSYGLLCAMMGEKEAGERHIQLASDMARRWEEMASDGDHYRLTFDKPETWSLKYNLIWDTILNLNIFNPEIRRKEVAYYLTNNNRYGTPLDCRKTYTKADWLVWAATFADKREDFEALVNPLWDFLHESTPRVPFTDWYYTIDGRVVDMINRSVVGGLFIKILANRCQASN